MKKSLIWLLLLAIFIPSVAFTSENNREKINSLSDLKFFSNIVKKDGHLFGFRIINKNRNENKKASTTPEVDLEKISSPSDIPNFDKIRKMGTALWGIRKIVKDNLGTATITPEMVICLKSAIDKKDLSVKSAISSAKDSLTNAITARNICQKSALDQTNNPEIIKAFKICNNTFSKSAKASREAQAKARNDAWKIFRNEIKTCYGVASTSRSFEKDNVLLNDGGEALEL